MIIKAMAGNIIATIANKLTIKRTLSEFKKVLTKVAVKVLKKDAINLSKNKPNQES
jgi:hypothetical protein